MIDPQARLVAALKSCPGLMADAVYRAPGQAPINLRVSPSVSLEREDIGPLTVRANVRLVSIHESDIGTAEPVGQLDYDGATWNVQVAADRDKSGWWRIGLTPLRQRP